MQFVLIDFSVIFMIDIFNQIKNKVNKYVFSGGKVFVEEYCVVGGDIDVDVVYQYFCFFFEDDEEFEKIWVVYFKGEFFMGEFKVFCIKEFQIFVVVFQERRVKVDDVVVK